MDNDRLASELPDIKTPSGCRYTLGLEFQDQMPEFNPQECTAKRSFSANGCNAVECQNMYGLNTYYDVGAFAIKFSYYASGTSIDPTNPDAAKSNPCIPAYMDIAKEMSQQLRPKWLGKGRPPAAKAEGTARADKAPEADSSDSGKKERERRRREQEALARSKKLTRTGIIALQEGQVALANERLSAAVQANPRNVDALLSYGIVLKLLGDSTGFGTQIARALKLERKLKERLEKLMGKPRGRSAKKPGPRKDPWLAIADGLIAEALNRDDDAMDNYDQAVTRGPGIWMGWALRGILRTAHKDCNGAFADLDRAVQVNFTFKPQAQYYESRCT